MTSRVSKKDNTITVTYSKKQGVRLAFMPRRVVVSLKGSTDPDHGKIVGQLLRQKRNESGEHWLTRVVDILKLPSSIEELCSGPTEALLAVSKASASSLTTLALKKVMDL